MAGGLLALSLLGAFAFGLVIGWITYRTLRRKGAAAIGDIATVVGAVGGAAVTAAFQRDTGAFGAYSLGLAVGFFGYLAYARRIAASSDARDAAIAPWLEETGAPPAAYTHVPQPPPGPSHPPTPPPR